MGAHGLGELQTALQLLHHRQGRGFGGDQSQTAVVIAGAAHRLGQQGSRNGGEATQQRLRQQGLGPIGGHIGNHNILALAETQITTAIGRGQASQLRHGVGLQPAHRHIQPHPAQAFLLLGMDTAEIARGPVHKMGAVVIQQVGVGTTLVPIGGPQGGSIGIEAQSLDQIHQPAAIAGRAVAMGAVVMQHRQGEGGYLSGPEPKAERYGQFVALGGEKAPNQHREAKLAVPQGGQKGEVVVEQKAIGGTANGDIEFAGQVAGAAGTQQGALDGLHDRPRIEPFLGIQPRQRVAGDIARVVVTRLTAGQPKPLQSRHQGGHVFEEQTPELEVLAGGDVGAAVLSTTIDQLSKHRQLPGLDGAVGQTQAHHETSRCNRPEEDTQPLEVHREGDLIEGLPAVAPQLLQSGGEIKTAEISLGLL